MLGNNAKNPTANPMSNFSAGYNFIFLKLLVITKEHDHDYGNENLTKLKERRRKDQSD